MDQKKMASEKAAEYIHDGMIVGLGTGSTAFYLVEKLGEMVKQGLSIRAVATSINTSRHAKKLGIPLISIEDVDAIDLVIDGVDEIDPDFNAMKGGGGALFREKMVAEAAKEVIWIMDSSKQVDALGAFPLPVEILSYGYTHILKKMEEQLLHPQLRRTNFKNFITDNHNYIVDLHLGKPFDIKVVTEKLNGITGVMEHGLFLNLCSRIIVGTDTGVKIFENATRFSKNLPN